MTQPPPLTAQARAQAAAAGVAARQARAETRQQLARGEVTLAQVLAAAHGEHPRARALARMKVVALLSSLRGIGPIRAADLMAEVGIASNRRVGGLGVHQAAELVELLERRRSAP